MVNPELVDSQGLNHAAAHMAARGIWVQQLTEARSDARYEARPSVPQDMGNKAGQEEGSGKLCPLIAHCTMSDTNRSQPGGPLPQSGGGFKPQGVIHPAALSEFDELLAAHEPALCRAFAADHDERQETKDRLLRLLHRLHPRRLR